MMALCTKIKHAQFFVWITAIIFFNASQSLVAQEAPPRPITIYINPAQGLNFGTFTQGVSGGSVIIYPSGVRSVTGDVLQLSSGIPFSPAIFEVEANPGTVVSILNGPDVQLVGSNGGTMTLQIGLSGTGSPFITNIAPPGRTEVRIGGVLLVGNPLTNPGGNYSGTFMITFIQE